jgi:cell division protein FtsZ
MSFFRPLQTLSRRISYVRPSSVFVRRPGVDLSSSPSLSFSSSPLFSIPPLSSSLTSSSSSHNTSNNNNSNNNNNNHSNYSSHPHSHISDVSASLETLRPRITVFGVGGGGTNAVNNMIRSSLVGVDFVVANTDAQALSQSPAPKKIQLGSNLTHGLGAGARPDIGKRAAEESMDEILEAMQGAHMVFITAGLGGGTGTGAAPVIARAAYEQGLLTVGVVTRPFSFEGRQRSRIAEYGLTELAGAVDTMIVIPNQNLFKLASEKTSLLEAFAMADHVLFDGVKSITDLMVQPGLINLDFADVRTVMSDMGRAMMGSGVGSTEKDGTNRAVAAAERAISNPLLEDVSLKKARGVLINICGGSDMTLFEVDAAANRIRQEVDEEANIIFGSTFAENEGEIRVAVVATGVEGARK